MSAIAIRISLLFAATVLFPALAQAQSITAEPSSAGTIVRQAGDRYGITGGTQAGGNLFHSFERFGLRTSETATFFSRPDIQNILGRVTGGQASAIDGVLQVTGGNANLYLLNPAGIIFGQNARLDIPASFFATTATAIGFGDRAFQAIGPIAYATLVGTPDRFDFALAQPGAIVNLGDLAVKPGNHLALIGGTVITTGTLSASGGTITIAAIPGENRVRVSQQGSLLSLELEAIASQDTALPFTPQSLPELLTMGGSRTTALTARSDTRSDANSDTRSDSIQLNGVTVPMQPGTAIVAGTLNADSTTSRSSEINVLGDRVALLGATLTAVGLNGGTVRIGGGDRGRGSVFNASRTFVSRDSWIAADALQTGNGGSVTVWADKTTQFLGTISAQGGTIAGNGGFVEVSGQNLLFDGNVNVSARNGLLGTLLLDPTNITIVAYDPSSSANSNLPTILAADLPGNVTIDASTLESQSGNIILEATNNLTIGNGLSLNFSTLPGRSITFAADAGTPDGVGAFSMDTSQRITAAQQTISITGAGIQTGQLDTRATGTGNGGTISLRSSGNLTSGDLLATASSNAGPSNPGNSGTGGAITLTAIGNITTGVLASGSQTNGMIGMIGSSGTGGAVTVNAGSNVTIGSINSGSQVSTMVGGNAGNAGNVTITSGGALQVTNGIGAGSESLAGRSGNGGTIALSAGDRLISGAIDSGSRTNLGLSNVGTGGSVSLAANSDLTVSQITATAAASPQTIYGTGGEVILSANGRISTALGIATSNNNVSLTANKLTLNRQQPGPVNTLTIQPFSLSQAIAVGGAIESSADTLDLTTATIANLPAANSLIIGAATGNSNLRFVGPVTIPPTTLRGLTVLTGADTPNTWNLTGQDSGQLNGINFITTRSLQGGSSTDTFTLAAGASLSGTIAGGSGQNTLVAANSLNTWTITGANTGTLNGTGFSAMQSLVGGAGDDSFQFTTSDFLSSRISAGTGALRLTGSSIRILSDVSADGAVSVQANQDVILTGSLTAPGQAIRLSSTTGTITTSGSNAGINTSSLTSAGGPIALAAPQGPVSIGDLNSSGTSGGPITITANTAIATGAINSSGRSGNGGSVTLDPIGDVHVAFINAQGGDFGTGGAVQITAGKFFRAIDSFTDRTGLAASISTAGGQGGGAITIRHGGNGDPVFILGTNFGNNGTLAAITSGGATFSAGESFQGSVTRDNLQILTNVPSAPPLVPLLIPPIVSPSLPLVSPIVSPSLPIATRQTSVTSVLTPPDCNPNCGSSLPSLPSVPAFVPPRIATVALEQDQLLEIQKQTGIKPALLYVGFGGEQSTAPIAREAIATQQVTNYLKRSNPIEPPPLTLTSQDDELTLLLVTPNGKPIYKRISGATRRRVLQVAQQFRDAVADRRAVRTRRYLAPAQQLYTWLIAPLEADLQAQGIQNLGFILETGLRFIPLAALHDGQNFLIQRYSIGLMPSLSLVDTHYVDIRQVGILSAGTSTFAELDPLPAVPVELAAISQVWQGQSTTLQDDQFTTAQLRRTRQQQPFGIIHLATHGEFRAGNSSASYIQFRDRRLRLDQLRQLGFNDPPVELMVLSACRMALGSDEAELGFAGMALQAGAKSALASLWNVSDEGTLGLMTAFYQKLQQAPIKAEALRQAQLAMKDGKVALRNGKLIVLGAGGRSFDLSPELAALGDLEFVSPYYWAGFSLVGSPW